MIDGPLNTNMITILAWIYIIGCAFAFGLYYNVRCPKQTDMQNFMGTLILAWFWPLVVPITIGMFVHHCITKK